MNVYATSSHLTKLFQLQLLAHPNKAAPHNRWMLWRGICCQTMGFSLKIKKGNSFHYKKKALFTQIEGFLDSSHCIFLKSGAMQDTATPAVLPPAFYASCFCISPKDSIQPSSFSEQNREWRGKRDSVAVRSPWRNRTTSLSTALFPFTPWYLSVFDINSILTIH